MSLCSVNCSQSLTSGGVIRYMILSDHQEFLLLSPSHTHLGECAEHFVCFPLSSPPGYSMIMHDIVGVLYYMEHSPNRRLSLGELAFQ